MAIPKFNFLECTVLEIRGGGTSHGRCQLKMPLDKKITVNKVSC